MSWRAFSGPRVKSHDTFISGEKISNLHTIYQGNRVFSEQITEIIFRTCLDVILAGVLRLFNDSKYVNYSRAAPLLSNEPLLFEF